MYVTWIALLVAALLAKEGFGRKVFLPVLGVGVLIDLALAFSFRKSSSAGACTICGREADGYDGTHCVSHADYANYNR